MLVKRQLHCQRQLQLRTPLRLPVKTVRAVSRSHAAVVRAAAVKHADAASADLVPAAPAQVDAPALSQTTAVESPEGTATVTATSAAGSSSDGELPIMKVGRNSDIAKSARFVQARLLENAAGTPLLMRAIGAEAAAVAVRILARASEMLQTSDSSSILSFQPKRKELFLDRPFCTYPETTWMGVFDIYIAKHAAKDYPTEPAAGVKPLWVGNSTEVSSVTSHIIDLATNLAHVKRPGPVAELRLLGISGYKFKAAVAGIINASIKVCQVGKSDLTVTVSRIVEKKASSNQQQQKQQDIEGPQAAVAAEAPGGANESSSSGAAGGAGGQYKTTIALKVHVCELRAPTAAEKRRASSCDCNGGRPDSTQSAAVSDVQSAATSTNDPQGSQPQAARDARPSTTPGVVEVPEEEWRQLQEQIELVPHLTEQLQVMTRQHEQLLSLLAAQQQPLLLTRRQQQEKGEQQQ